ncbi:hypothetical protein VMF7928_02684 [Vibrio marisflavi CECT 7928]|uniref:Solute-binding protein family 3/N-terminal domain-containing protein n=1 Tax=Vibrio marisflavi CECT 7928 TaxID=634439 RepID=A0ABN8E5S6_9VIBR|nr:hypothetical protein VMF7928_02684 [Vibrio marisflavi CECT 7928]
MLRLSRYLLVFLFFRCFDLLASTELKVVRGNENYSPYEISGADGELYGLHIDLVKLAAKNAGYDISFNSMPWKRAIRDVQTGAADAIIYISRNPEREKYLYFLDENQISEVRFHFLVNVKDKKEIQFSGDIDTVLKDRTLLVQRGFSYGATVDKPEYSKHEVTTADQLVSMISRERAKVGIMNIYGFNYIYGEQNNVVALPTPVKTNKIYIAFSKKSSSLATAKKFAQALKSLKGTAEYNAIVMRYLGGIAEPADGSGK